MNEQENERTKKRPSSISRIMINVTFRHYVDI